MLSINIAIIGGGASGLFFAMTAADLLRKEKNNSKINITVFEKESRIGRKLLATGNGKCNLTNTNISTDCYNGSFAKAAEGLLQIYNTDYILKEFKKYGLFCSSDEKGRIYPYSRQASAVLDCMLTALNNLNISICCNTKIIALKKSAAKYILSTNDGELLFDYVIIAAGGRASPNLGSDGSGFSLLSSLGIKSTSYFPSLCPIPVAAKHLKGLKGIRCQCAASLIADGHKLKTEYGELQLTEKAISGICIFQLSHFVNEYLSNGTVYGKRTSKIKIEIDLFPDIDEYKLFLMLKERKQRLRNITIEQFFIGLINKKLGISIYSDCAVKHEPSENASLLNDNDLKLLAHKFKAWSFTPSAISDWSAAQVTAGGVEASQLNPETLECIKSKHLYCIGEAVDIDGCCGGYNLHWAWTSAIVAAKAVCDKIKECYKIGDNKNDKNYRHKNADRF